MFLFGMFRKYLIMAAIAAAVAGAAYFYYTDTQKRITALAAESATLKSAVQISESSLKLMSEENAKQVKLNSELQVSLQKAEQTTAELRNLLQQHDLTKLALAKPGLIEKRINDATKKLWGDIAASTNNGL